MAEVNRRSTDARGDFWWFSTVASSLLSTLAIAALVRRALELGSLSAPLALVMEAYQSTTRLLLGWAEPYLQSVLSWLGGLFNWQLKLLPHWRDVLIVTGVLVTAYTRSARHQEAVNRYVVFIACGLSALVAAMVTGVLQLESPDLSVQMLIASLPLLLVMWPAFLIFVPMQAPHREIPAIILVSVLLLSVPAVETWWSSLWFDSASGLGLFSLATLIFAWGAGLVVGEMATARKDEINQIRFTTGLTIIGGFLGAALFFAADAGLKLISGD